MKCEQLWRFDSRADLEVGDTAGLETCATLLTASLLDSLATKLLLGEFKPGDCIKVVTRGSELLFAKK